MVEHITIEHGNEKVVRSWGADIGPDELIIHLTGEDSSVTLNGFFEFFNDSKREIVVKVIHDAPGTESRVIVRGLLHDGSNTTVLQSAIINKGAKGSRTHVEARAILLSDAATATLKPQLEIDEDDVRATHAAHVGPLEEDEIFYLMSRGISRKSSERLLIDSFLYPVREAIL